jgi:lysozyme family protein
MLDFKRCLMFVLAREGGYVNNPNDRGGSTNRGVTQATYDSWRTRQGLPLQSVKLIADAELAALYRRDYWDKVAGDDLPSPVNLVVFDGAVNSGPGRAVRWLQDACGTVADGAIGPNTLAAIHHACDFHGVQHIAEVIVEKRQQFYESIVARDPSQKVFLRGWTNRLTELRKEIESG